MILSQTEENYLKCIFKLEQSAGSVALTNHIATAMQTTAGTVTDMMKRLAEKQLVLYEKYKGVQLTAAGNQIATQLVRKHRLWEVFLHDKLGFEWHEVHDIAEELEHVSSITFVDRLAHFLGNPKFDPHGDPIPDAHGNITQTVQILLSKLPPDTWCTVTGVQEHSTVFLNYLHSEGLVLGAVLRIAEAIDYDQSRRIVFKNGNALQLGEKVCNNLFVQPIKA